MLSRTEAERIAQSIHVMRPDWPVASLVTLIVRDLADWPLLDTYVALGYIAVEQTATGNWVSATPARVKEQGPWRGTDDHAGDAIEAKRRAADELAGRMYTIQRRSRAAADCELCDSRGYMPSGHRCGHNPGAAAGARCGADAARAQIKPYVPRPGGDQ